MEYFGKKKWKINAIALRWLKIENIRNILQKMDNDGKSRNGMLANGSHTRKVLPSLLKNETRERAVESTEM